MHTLLACVPSDHEIVLVFSPTCSKIHTGSLACGADKCRLIQAARLRQLEFYANSWYKKVQERRGKVGRVGATNWCRMLMATSKHCSCTQHIQFCRKDS